MMTNGEIAALGHRLSKLTGTPGKECILTYRTITSVAIDRRRFRRDLHELNADGYAPTRMEPANTISEGRSERARNLRSSPVHSNE